MALSDKKVKFTAVISNLGRDGVVKASRIFIVQNASAGQRMTVSPLHLHAKSHMSIIELVVCTFGQGAEGHTRPLHARRRCRHRT